MSQDYGSGSQSEQSNLRGEYKNEDTGETRKQSPFHMQDTLNVHRIQSPTTAPIRLGRRLPPSPEWSPAPSSDSAGEVVCNTAQKPSYMGYIKSPLDAVLLLAACDMPVSPKSPRASKIPRRISRRLLDDERASLIRSGSIFIWDEHEASIRRWTDGRCWSASRVCGCFLTYRELEVRKKSSSESGKEGAPQNLYKADGLIKQSFSITTASNRKLHVISYYRKQDVRMNLLQRVSEDPNITGVGPGSLGVQVDEKEFGDLLNREDEKLPETVSLSRSRHLPPTPADSETLGMKRPHDDERPDLFSSGVSISSANNVGKRPLLPSLYNDDMDGRYGNSYHKYDEEALMPCYYHQAPLKRPRTSSGYTPPALQSNAVTHHRFPLPRGATDRMRDSPTLSSERMRYPTGALSPNYMPATIHTMPHPPRHSDIEQDSIEALISLRSNASQGSIRLPPLPHLTHDVMHTHPTRSRPAPVSASDRDALQKLSVRV
ncbi:Gluconate transport-inducing protein [Malassezia yamatoensis]|uniref:Gluconate transport-inducing protein n=1 Tax=Malassezia yamatoensis TaxID=253288 RepID=A0AAJ6CHR1_9BASI|nr:Gluconate transport-inducing protein [Malassezia yamatoensis]